MTEVGRNFEDLPLDSSDISSCRYVIVCDNSCFGFDDCDDDDRRGEEISSSRSMTTNCNKPAQRQLWQYSCYSCLSTAEFTDDDHIDFGTCCSHHKKKELRNKVHLSSTLTTETTSTSSSGEGGPPHNGTVILFYQIKEQLYDLHDGERNDLSHHQQDMRGDFQQNVRFFPSIQDKMVEIRQQLDDKRNTLNDVLSRDYRCTTQEDESIATSPSKPPPIKDKKRINNPQLKYKNYNTNKKEQNKEGKSNPPFLPKSPSFKKKTRTHRPLQIETKKKKQLKNIISSTVSINSKKRENDQDIKNRIERRNQRHYVTKQYIISKDETTSHGSDFGIKKSKKIYGEIVKKGVAIKYPNHLYELTSSDKLRNSSLASSSTDIHFSSTISTSETSSSSSSSYSSYKSSPIIEFRGGGENDIFNRLYKLSKNQQKAGQEKRAKIERALRIKNQDHFNGIHGSNVFENKKISRKEAEKLYLRGIKHLLELDRRRSERAKQQMNQDNYQPFLFRESLKEKVLSSDIED